MYFIADVVAEFVERHAFLGQGGAELLQVHVVLSGDAVQCFIQGRPVHADTGLVGILQLDTVVDHAFQQLFFQHRTRWQGYFSCL